MLRAILWLLVAIIAVWAHRSRATQAPRNIVRLATLLGLALVAWRALDLAAATHLIRLGPLPWFAIKASLGLLVWTGIAGLLGSARRKRDLAVRVPLFALTVALGLARSGAVAVPTLPAIVGYRWMRALPTRALFSMALPAFALLGMLWIHIPTSMSTAGQTPVVSDLYAFQRWAYILAGQYVFFGLFPLLWAFVRDPSLGLRRVAHRLALSHVLVVGVPLALTVLLWLATTILGVGAERATVAARLIQSEGRELANGFGAALATGDPEASLDAWATRHAQRWPRLSVWSGRDTSWTRWRGDAAPDPRRLTAWLTAPDSLRAPGLIAIGDSIYLGAASATPTGGVVALVPASTFIAGAPGRITGATLTLDRSTVNTGGGGLTITTDEDTADARGDAAAALERRAASRAASIRTPQDTFVTAPGAPSSSAWSLVTGGHAVVAGLAWRDARWTRVRYLLTATVGPGAALAGLSRSAAENPIGMVPIIVIGFLAVTFALVVLFDLFMVMNMGRSITTAIRSLRVGAEHLEAGDLAHRIRVQGDDDLWGVAGAFNTAAAGLERARVVERERDRLESELALARQIQARLLPATSPTIAGLEIAGFSESAREVGGDYYDHLDLGGGRALLVIADVSGKGVPAALLMSGFRASLMSQDLSSGDPASVATRLNEFVYRSVEPGKFITAFLAFVDAASGRVSYVNAGHNAPVLVRRGGGHELLETGGFIFGIMGGASFERGEVALGARDLLVLYTDGVTEGANAEREMWGEERLTETLIARAGEPCADLVKGIASEVRTFEGEQGPADDITLLAARRT